MSDENSDLPEKVKGGVALDAPQREPFNDLTALSELGNPDFTPIFLDPERAESAEYTGESIRPNFDSELTEPEDPAIALGIKNDWGKGPSPGYRERHRAIARYNALGLSNNEIAAKLNYSPTAISLALKKPWVQEEVARFRTQYFDEDINRALKAAGSDAIKHIHKTILDEGEKSDLRSTNSRWVLEKLTGKAKQEVSVESNTLTAFMDLLRETRERGETLEPAILDVTPNPENSAQLAESPGDTSPDFDAWLDQNL